LKTVVGSLATAPPNSQDGQPDTMLKRTKLAAFYYYCCFGIESHRPGLSNH